MKENKEITIDVVQLFKVLWKKKIIILMTAIVSVLTEAIVWGIQLYYTLTYLKEVPILRNMFKIILASVMMYGFLYLLKPVLIFAPALNVLVYAIIGVIIYLTIILSLKVINLAELRQQFVKK